MAGVGRRPRPGKWAEAVTQTPTREGGGGAVVATAVGGGRRGVDGAGRGGGSGVGLASAAAAFSRVYRRDGVIAEARRGLALKEPV